MKIFIDSADLSEVAKYVDAGVCDGVTTNPSIFLKAGVRGGMGPMKQRAQAIAQLIYPRPYSIEVTSDEPQEVLRQAREYASWGPNIAVKVTVTDRNGTSLLPVVRQLTAEGISVNVTALTTLTQAFMAAKAIDAGYRECQVGRKTGFVSIFAGRISEEQGVARAHEVLVEFRRWLDLHKIESSEIIVGSIRSAENVELWARSGAHILTITPDVLAKLTVSARTKETVVQFLNDAEKSLQELT
jgi:transaldolase